MYCTIGGASCVHHCRGVKRVKASGDHRCRGCIRVKRGKGSLKGAKPNRLGVSE